MKIRLDDSEQLGDLLKFLRKNGCIAYAIDGADAVEALRPYAFGPQEQEEIRALVDEWLAARPGVASTLASD